MKSSWCSTVLIGVFVALLSQVAAQAQGAPDDVPLIVVETSKGTFAIQAFTDDAPESVDHVLALVRAGFYDGQRVHRAQAGFVVQFGDPQTRDVRKRDLWGRGRSAGSGDPVGAVELSARLSHRKGAVALAHMGSPADAESQLFITLADRPELDGRYAIIGQVVAGQDVPETLQVGDEIRRMYVRE